MNLKEIRAGILKGMSASEIGDTIQAGAVCVDEDKVKVEESKNKWNADNLHYLIDNLDKYLNSYEVNLNKKRIATVRNGLQKFAAFKAAIYSQSLPLEESGDIIASQIIKGVRWAMRPDLKDVSDEELQAAKGQAQNYFGVIKEYLLSQYSEEDKRKAIETAYTNKMSGFMWRADSPFLRTGKKYSVMRKWIQLLRLVLRRSRRIIIQTKSWRTN